MKELKQIITIFFIIIFNNICYSQYYQWAIGIGNTNSDYGRNIAIDSSNNIYVIGNFSDSADFDPSIGYVNLTGDGLHIFLAKYDSNGNYLWAKNIGYGNSNAEYYGIKIDDSNNVYITGRFQSIANFVSGIDTLTLTAVSSSDIFFAKFDSNVNNIWAKSIVCGFSNAITVDSDGNVYITGSFNGTVDFDPSPSNTATLTTSNFNVFIAKYNFEGNYIWAKKIENLNQSVSHSITIDGTGNIYITGNFAGQADFDPNIGVANLTSIGGSYDIFLAKYDSSGNYIWAKSIGSTSFDESNNVIIDDFGNIYITGNFQGTVDFDPNLGVANLTSVGYSDIFFAKYDSNGNYIWAKSFGDSTNYDYGFGIAVDGSKNVYLTGNFKGTADFNPDLIDVANLTSGGNRYALYIAKYDNNGNYIWAKNIDNIPNSFYGSNIAIDNLGSLYITGSYVGTTDFDIELGTVFLTSAGYDDIFIAKYSQNTGIVEPNAFETEGFRIYPNPANGRLFIKNNNISRETHINIFNVQRKQIVSDNFCNQNLFEIDVRNLTKGIYILEIQTDNSIETKKLIIQ